MNNNSLIKLLYILFILTTFALVAYGMEPSPEQPPAVVDSQSPAESTPEINAADFKTPYDNELSEDKPTFLENDDPNILKYFQSTQDTLKKCNMLMKVTLEKREALYRLFYDTEADALSALQGADNNKGAFMEQLLVSAVDTNDTQASVAPQFESELGKLNGYVQNINNLKVTLKEILTKIDADIVKQKDLILKMLDGHTLILKQKTAQEAEATNKEADDYASEFIKIDTAINNDDTKKFQSAVEQIQQNLTNIKNLISELEQKGFAWQLAQAQKKADAPAAQTAPEQQPASTLSSPAQQNMVGNKQESFTGHLFKRMADLFIDGVTVIRLSSQKIKKYITDYIQNKPNDQQPTQQPIQTQPAPSTPPEKPVTL